MKITVFQNENQIAEYALDPSKEYVIGRSPQCDIVLKHPEISRRHAKLTCTNGVWSCESVSNHVDLEVSGQLVKSVSLVNGSHFEILDFKFKYSETTASQPSSLSNKTIVLPQGDGVEGEEDFGEKTNVGSWSSKFALFRLDETGDPFEEVVLGEGIIEAGRSEECEIILKDPKASRKHFSIEKTATGYLIRDLESTHGILINGEKISQHSLSSGDRLTIGQEQFLFQEIHPSFENMKPAVINRGAVALDPSANRVVKIDMRKGNKLKPVYFALGVLLIYGLYTNTQEPEKKHTQRAPTNATQDSALEKLSPEQVKFLESTYNLSLNLYTSGKYDLAALEISKIFQLVPQYKDARNIEALCQQALELKKQREEAARLAAEQEELKIRVDGILDNCENLLKAKKYSQVESCVARITEMDPDNGRGKMLIDSAQVAMDELESSAEAKRDSLRRQAYAQKTFDTAQKALREKRYPTAISQFTSVTQASFNDKQGLKQKALEGIKLAKEKMREGSQTFVTEGKSALDSKDYKTAILKFNKALQIFNDNPDAKQLKEKAISELRVEMKNLYSESVIEENLGNIESAKKKWKLILEQDLPGDNYYEKAKSKTNKYER